MKKRSKKMKIFGLVCTITGMALAVFGISCIAQSKSYSNSSVSVDIPETKVDDSVYLVEK